MTMLSPDGHWRWNAARQRWEPAAGDDGYAAAALICGLASIPLPGLASIPAIVCAIASMSRTRRAGQPRSPLAAAGFALGFSTALLCTAIGALLVAGFLTG